MEGQDPGPTIGSNGFGSAGAESVVELPPPTDPASPADATIQPAYAAPPESPAEQLLLPEYPAAFDPALAVMPKRRRPNRWLLIAIGVLAAILAVDGAGIAVNAALSSLYNPDRAVTDYFAAQSRGEVSGMMANATFLVGSDPAFFSSSAVAGMMVLPQNRDVKDVGIVSTHSIDYSTASVDVAMTWAGIPRRQAYKVRMDSSRVHELIYHSWRVEIPFATIQLALPNQAGPMAVDSINTASSDPETVQVIQGYHEIEMSANFAYDTSTRLIDAVGYPDLAEFKSTVGSTATYLATKAVTLAYTTCDPSAYWGCLNHLYSAQPGHYWTWDLPGYGSVAGTTYQYALAGDPTVGMTLLVTTQPGIVEAFGSCAATLTLDGNRTYRFRGGWSAKLTWSSGAFVADLHEYCFDTKDDSGTGTV